MITNIAYYLLSVISLPFLRVRLLTTVKAKYNLSMTVLYLRSEFLRIPDCYCQNTTLLTTVFTVCVRFCYNLFVTVCVTCSFTSLTTCLSLCVLPVRYCKCTTCSLIPLYVLFVNIHYDLFRQFLCVTVFCLQMFTESRLFRRQHTHSVAVNRRNVHNERTEFVYDEYLCFVE